MVNPHGLAASLMVLHCAIATCYYNGIRGVLLKSLIIAIIACYALTLAPVAWVDVRQIAHNHQRRIRESHPVGLLGIL